MSGQQGFEFGEARTAIGAGLCVAPEACGISAAVFGNGIEQGLFADTEAGADHRAAIRRSGAFSGQQRAPIRRGERALSE